MHGGSGKDLVLALLVTSNIIFHIIIIIIIFTSLASFESKLALGSGVA